MTLTNATSRRIEALPDLYLTRDGTTVSTPLPHDDVGLVLELAAGAARDFSATASQRNHSDQRPLPPGGYELHAVLPFGAARPAVGGPWPLEDLWGLTGLLAPCRWT